MGEEGCEQFTWAYHEWRDDPAPLSPLHTPFSDHSHTWTPSVEVSVPSCYPPSHNSPRSSCTLHCHMPSHRKIYRSDCTSTATSLTLQNDTPSIAPPLSGNLRPLSYVCRRNFASHEDHGTSPTPSTSSLGHYPHTSSVDHKPSGPCIWPYDFYADEMDIGFRRCALESNKHCPVLKVFQEHFHVKFVPSTFYDHHQHWKSVSKLIHQQYIGYRHTECGRWLTFVWHEITGKKSIVDDL